MRMIYLLTLSILFTGYRAEALFEVKGGYGILASSASDLGSFYGGSSSNIPSAIPNAGFTADAVFKIPFLGFGVGLRTESMNIKYDSTALGIENTLSRNSLVVNYRLLDSVLFLGPILTYGINHSSRIKMTSGSTVLNDIASSNASSYSLGLEVGASLAGIIVGAEAGTQQMKFNDAKDSANPTEIHDIDLSGPYAKLFVGFGI